MDLRGRCPHLGAIYMYITIIFKAFLGRMEVYINDQGHMTKMAAIAKTFKNLLQNQKAHDFETCHEASGNGALQSLYKA